MATYTRTVMLCLLMLVVCILLADVAECKQNGSTTTTTTTTNTNTTKTNTTNNKSHQHHGDGGDVKKQKQNDEQKEVQKQKPKQVHEQKEVQKQKQEVVQKQKQKQEGVQKQKQEVVQVQKQKQKQKKMKLEMREHVVEEDGTIVPVFEEGEVELSEILYGLGAGKQFIEINGYPNTSLQGHSIIILNGEGDTISRLSLDNYKLSVDGFLLLQDTTDSFLPTPLPTAPIVQLPNIITTLPTDGTLSFLLVKNALSEIPNNVDANHDGVMDVNLNVMSAVGIQGDAGHTYGDFIQFSLSASLGPKILGYHHQINIGHVLFLEISSTTPMGPYSVEKAVMLNSTILTGSAEIVIRPGRPCIIPITVMNIYVYDDSLLGGWEDWGWAPGMDLAHTANTYSGSAAAISLTFGQGSWVGIYFHSKSPIDLDHYSNLRFYYYTTSSGRDMRVQFYDGSGAAIGSLSGAHYVVDNTWTEVVIPTSSFGIVNTYVSGFHIMFPYESSGVDVEMQIDNIYLQTGTDAYYPPVYAPTATPETSDNAVFSYRLMETLWEDWTGSWSDGGLTSDRTSYVFTPSNYAGVYFHTSTPFDVAQYNTILLNLRAYGATPSQKLQVVLYDDSATPAPIGTAYVIRNGLVAWTYSLIEIPVMSFNIPYGSLISGIAIMGAVGTTQMQVEFNDLRFTTTAPAPATQYNIVYADSLQGEWEDWGWAKDLTYEDTTVAPHDGTQSISLTFGNYNGIYIHSSSPIDLRAYEKLEFHYRSAATVSPWVRVQMYTDGSGPSGGPGTVGTIKSINLLPSTTSWQQVSIDVGDFVTRGSLVTGFHIQIHSGITMDGKVNLDQIVFTADSASYTFPTNQPALPSVLDNVLYGGKLITPSWATWGWASSYITSSGYQGLKNSIAFAPSNYDGVYFHTTTPFDPSAYEVFTYAIYTAEEDVSLKVTFFDTSSTPVPIGNNVVVHKNNNDWEIVTHNIKTFNIPTGTTISGVVISGTKPGSQNWVLIDNVRFASEDPALSTTNNQIYYDSLLGGWEDWGWANDLSLYDTTQKLDVNAIKMTAQNWNGLYLHTSVSIDPRVYETLSFQYYAATAVTMRVEIYNGDGSYIIGAPHTFTTTASSWQTLVIPITTFQVYGQLISGFHIQHAGPNPNSGGVIYFDNIEFLSSSATHSVPPAYVYTTPANTMTVLDDTGLVGDWEEWGWAADRAFRNVKTLFFTPSNFDGVYFHTDTPFSLSDFISVSFSVSAESGNPQDINQKLQVIFFDNSATPLAVGEPVKVPPALVGATFSTVVIPVSAFNIPQGTMSTGFAITGALAATQTGVLIEDVLLVSSLGPTTPPDCYATADCVAFTTAINPAIVKDKVEDTITGRSVMIQLVSQISCDVTSFNATVFPDSTGMHVGDVDFSNNAVCGSVPCAKQITAVISADSSSSCTLGGIFTVTSYICCGEDDGCGFRSFDFTLANHQICSLYTTQLSTTVQSSGIFSDPNFLKPVSIFTIHDTVHIPFMVTESGLTISNVQFNSIFLNTEFSAPISLLDDYSITNIGNLLSLSVTKSEKNNHQIILALSFNIVRGYGSPFEHAGSFSLSAVIQLDYKNAKRSVNTHMTQNTFETKSSKFIVKF